MPPMMIAFLAAIAGGGYYFWNKNKTQATANAQASVPPIPPVGLTYDPGMTQDAQNAVNAAMANENNPANLRALADTLASKGYTNSAAALNAKAAATSLTGTSITPPANPSTILVQPPGGVVPPVVATVTDVQDNTMSILQMQKALNMIGVSGTPLPEDGMPTENLVAVIATFQNQAGLTPSGIPDSQTWAVMRAAIGAMGGTVSGYVGAASFPGYYHTQVFQQPTTGRPLGGGKATIPQPLQITHSASNIPRTGTPEFPPTTPDRDYSHGLKLSQDTPVHIMLNDCNAIDDHGHSTLIKKGTNVTILGGGGVGYDSKTHTNYFTVTVRLPDGTQWHVPASCVG